MPRYSEERKAAVLSRMLPPHNLSVPEVARKEGISEPTLYNWRAQAREQGVPVPGSRKNTSEDWPADARFAVVVETANMTEVELSEYCRSKGLYREHIREWKQAMVEGLINDRVSRQAERVQHRNMNKRMKQLQKELNRKDKALAETTALLVLRKKMKALWEENGDD